MIYKYIFVDKILNEPISYGSRYCYVSESSITNN